MALSPATAGFIKGLGIAIILAIVTYLGDSANLGIVSPAIATLIAAVASAIESQMKASSDGTTALFGLVSLK